MWMSCSTISVLPNFCPSLSFLIATHHLHHSYDFTSLFYFCSGTLLLTSLTFLLSRNFQVVSVICSVHFSRSVMSDSLQLNEPQHARPPCPSQVPESTQTHVHWVCDAIQSSHPLSSPSPPVLNLSQHQGLFKWVSSPRFTQTLRKACASGLVSLSALCLDLPLWFLKACQVLPLGLVKNELLYFISSCDLLLNLGLPPSPCAPLNVLIWQIHNTLINFPV